MFEKKKSHIFLDFVRSNLSSNLLWSPLSSLKHDSLKTLIIFVPFLCWFFEVFQKVFEFFSLLHLDDGYNLTLHHVFFVVYLFLRVKKREKSR